MNKKDLLPVCRYYHGEDVTPNGWVKDKAFLWGCEKKWVELTTSDDELLGEYLHIYTRSGLATFRESDITIPPTLKAYIYNRYSYWHNQDKSDAESFKVWFNKYYPM